MGTTFLAGYETNLRNDLKDLDSTNYLWATSELDRHIAHAVNDYTRVNPQVLSQTQTVVADANGNTWRQQISPIPSGYIFAVRVEYPIDNEGQSSASPGPYPSYLKFWEEIVGQGSLYLPVGDPPTAGDSIKVWYAAVHSVTSGSSTIPTEHEELITLGASAYAATAAARYAQNRLNASYWTPRGIQQFATEVMASYKTELENLKASYEFLGRGMVQWGDVPDDWQEL